MKSYTKSAKRFYGSKIWDTTRKQYVKSVGGLCERCLKNGLFVPGKIVHHKSHLDEAGLQDAATAIGFSNLELLCQECHNKEHHKTKPSRRYSFDKEGNIIEDSDEQGNL